MTRLEKPAIRDHKASCKALGCVRRRRAGNYCNRHYLQLRRGTLAVDPSLLPDDEIIDTIAVEIAASGTRLVRLTQAEREIAARRIIAAGGTLVTLHERLALPTIWAARQLAAKVNGEHCRELAACGYCDQGLHDLCGGCECAAFHVQAA